MMKYKVDADIADANVRLETSQTFFKIAGPAIIIVLTYWVVGILYAVNTPLWQVPDEPAHYNYVRALAEELTFPVMEPGDYDQAYLSQLTSTRFPLNLSIDAVEYEDHQPPLYYLLATPVYWLSGGAVLALRLFSLALGGVGVVMLLLILREFIPEQPSVAWLGGGIVAFIPQFIAMMSGINNDALTIALLWLWLWLALRYLRGKTATWTLGLGLGLLLLTKSTGYGALTLAILAIYLRYRREGQTFQWLVREMLLLFLPGLILGGVWWGRNITVYGWPDIMGLQRHDAVVVGQPRTMDWIARDGLLTFLRDALRTTFRSFWGQFGWMGVVVDDRIYRGLAIFSTLLGLGAIWKLIESLRAGLQPRQRDALLLLGMSALITIAMFLGYNLTFVQHQGRYLFNALPLFALAAVMGLARLAQRKTAIGLALFMLILLIVLGVFGLLRGDLPFWTMALIGATMVTLGITGLLPPKYHILMAVGLLMGLVVLDIVCLFGFIVPMLQLP
ncbi:MAG: DUF2142 domain-containing protein [Anaerolineae bacterium]|nr:DUF2142 domain-containing protein [Anaerolineae bacterium]